MLVEKENVDAVTSPPLRCPDFLVFSNTQTPGHLENHLKLFENET